VRWHLTSVGKAVDDDRLAAHHAEVHQEHHRITNHGTAETMSDYT
jgi:hypothetical protein